MAPARVFSVVLLAFVLLSGGARPVAAASFAQQVVDRTNVERINYGLPPLQTSVSLTLSAQSYATNMATNGFFSSVGLDGSTFIQRDEAAGYVGWTFLVENLGAGQKSPAAIVAAWMADPAHRANLLSPNAREVGVGYAARSGSPWGTYWVQELGDRPNISPPQLTPVVWLPHIVR